MNLQINFHENAVFENKIVNKFYQPVKSVIDHMIQKCEKNKYNKILDIGPGYLPFTKATHFIDHLPDPSGKHNYIKLDINQDKFPFNNQYFDFCFSRHTFEDIYNPYNAFHEMTRLSNSGYIETPSPLIEILKNVDAGSNENKSNKIEYCGYHHHRYIVWSDLSNNTLYFLPKMPIIETISIDETIKYKLIYLANNVPIFWNNYYIWSECKKPNIIMVTYDIHTYANIIINAVEKSIEYTLDFEKNM
jgi:hypothetical protein